MVFLFIWGDTWGYEVYKFEIQWKGLIFPMLNATKMIKVLSKQKLSGVSKFSILSIGQN